MVPQEPYPKNSDTEDRVKLINSAMIKINRKLQSKDRKIYPHKVGLNYLKEDEIEAIIKSFEGVGWKITKNTETDPEHNGTKDSSDSDPEKIDVLLFS